MAKEQPDWEEIAIAIQTRELPESETPRLLLLCIREQQRLEATLADVHKHIETMRTAIFGDDNAD